MTIVTSGSDSNVNYEMKKEAMNTKLKTTPRGKSQTHSKVKKCRFNDCENVAVDGTSKCAFHKNRRQCVVDNCTNQVYARKLCVRHGGKKQCQAENCEAHARGGGYCLQHGGFVVKRFCLVEGCSKQAHARQKCVRHGGGRRCKVEGCMQHARAGGLCNRHSHGHECRVEGCQKTAQHSGSICFRHAMELRAHGEDVPELNISKGGRLPGQKRQHVQRQYHTPNPPPQNGVMHPVNNSGANDSNTPNPPPQNSQASSNSNGPFGLPLKINVPTNIPKLNTRTPLGNNGFPTPRSHEFSLLMGLPSPQIDNSQLPSVLARANISQQRYDQSPGLNSMHFNLLQGPPSITRGLTRGHHAFPFSGLTPSGASSSNSHLNNGNSNGPQLEEDLDAILNSYTKFMGTESASPMAYHHNVMQQSAPTLLENIGLSVFDSGRDTPLGLNSSHNTQGNTRMHNNMHPQHYGYMPSPSPSGRTRLRPLLINQVQQGMNGPQHTNDTTMVGHNVDPPNDYTAQFFADSTQAQRHQEDPHDKVTPPGVVAA